MRFVFKIVHKCSRCKKEHKLGDFRSGCKILKMCIKCRERGKKSRNQCKCIHGRSKDQCKECDGVGICIHNRCKYRCKDCDGSSICQHNRIRTQCKDCGGAVFCEHNKQRSYCKICKNPIHITIKNMIVHSRSKDKKINKYDEPNFIDYPFIQHLISESNDKCYYCHCELQYTYYTNNLATIERLDNSLGHIKSNCAIACRTCNYTRVGSKEQSQ